MDSYPVRLARLLAGCVCYGLGIVLSVQANVGLAPWDAFHQGVSLVTGLPFGFILQVMGYVILAAAILLREPVGLGTLLNITCIGISVDAIQALGIIPQPSHLPGGILMLLAGQAVVAWGTYFYLGTGLGAGPRDMLMTAVSKRLPGIPVGLVRGIIEGSALLAGWLMGGKVGIGTILAVFGIGFLLQGVFAVTRFDVRSVPQEGIGETWKRLRDAVGARDKTNYK